MQIKRIIVKENEKTAVSLSFKDGLTAVENNDYVLDVIFCVLGKKSPSVFSKNYEFLAEVFVDDTYFVSGKKLKGASNWEVTVVKENSEIDCSKEYYEMLKTNDEIDNLSYFYKFKNQGYTHRLEHYKDILKYYPENDFANITHGYGTTRSFRGFMTQYIKNFKPIKLINDRNLYLKLLPNGRFVVMDAESNKKTRLSNNEKILYHYYSFLSLADFWARAERIRNLNRVNKPLIVSQFLEFLDNSIDLQEIGRSANRIGRQVIMLAPKNNFIGEISMDNKKQGLISSIKFWFLTGGMDDVTDDTQQDVLIAQKNGLKTTYIIEIDKTKDELLAAINNAKSDFVYVVVDDNQKRRELVKFIPDHCGIFCYGNPYGLGGLYQVLKNAKRKSN